MKDLRFKCGSFCSLYFAPRRLNTTPPEASPLDSTRDACVGEVAVRSRRFSLNGTHASHCILGYDAV